MGGGVKRIGTEKVAFIGLLESVCMLLIEVTQPYLKIHCTGDIPILSSPVTFGTMFPANQINILDLRRNWL